MKRLLFFFLVLVSCCFGEDTYLFLKGYLGDENLSFSHNKLIPIQEKEGGRILIHIDSSAGNIQNVFALAQEIYNIKLRTNKYVIVYIDGKGVGPAAIFPFLADELIVTPLVAWGDILYGVGEKMSLDEIRRGVQSLINPNRDIAHTLATLANAMTDPHYQLMDENGRGVIEREAQEGVDPLVLNLKGIESLGLIVQVMKTQAFLNAYLPQKEREEDYAKAVTAAEFKRKFDQYVVYHHDKENLIGYLHIGNDRPIDETTYIYVRFALDYFIKEKICFLVLNLDTPGGEVLSALKISNLLQKLDVEHRIPVIAFLDNWAVSAGAMLAYSCRFIGVLPNSLMGAAEPVILGKEGQMVSASEKMNSALRTQFGSLASFYGRNSLLAEAMVDKDMILVLRDHRIIKLNNESDVVSMGPSPDVIISGRGKLVTLNARELMDYGIADFEVPYKQIPPITDKEWDEGTFPSSKLLVFQQPILQEIPNARVIDYQDWRVVLFTILSHPMVSSLLLIGLVIGFYIEINTPGFGIPGAIAVGCLSLILLSSFASHAINWIEVILLAAGLILLALELFVIPGFGIVGVLGVALTILGLLALLLPGIGELDFFNIASMRLIGTVFFKRLSWLIGGLFFAMVMIVLMARFYSHRLFTFSKLVLKGEQDKKEGYVSGLKEGEKPAVGAYGEAVTSLRPAGKVLIGDKLYNAVSSGDYLEKKQPIEVVKIEGNHVVVKLLREQRDFSC